MVFKKIRELRKEVEYLRTTIEKLKSEITDISHLKKNFGIEQDDFPELDSELYFELSHDELRQISNKIKNLQRIWISQRPSLKIKKIFHGGCLVCNTPHEKGIIVCLNCQYFNADWSKPNLKNLCNPVEEKSV